DGPSGGAALMLLAYAEFSGKKLRYDLTATGTIELDGSIGKVGGVASKLKAAAEKGVKLFLIPVDQATEEGLDLIEEGRSKYGLQVVEVANADEAIGLAFTPAGSPVTAPEHVLAPLLLENVTALRGGGAAGMESIAESEYAATFPVIEELKTYVNDSGATMASVRKSMNLSRQLIDNGYYYSAANSIFLLKINAEAMVMNYRNITEKQFEDRVAAARKDMESIAFANKSDNNWQWVVGGQLRWHWAKDRLDGIEIDLLDGYDYQPLFKELALAENWLEAARKMNELAKAAAGGAGEAVDELKARSLAEKLLLIAQDEEGKVADTEVSDHLATAQQAFGDADYLASAFDSEFVISFVAALKKTRGKTAAEVGALLENTPRLAEFKNSMWAEEYFVHSLYSVAEANRSPGIEFLANAAKLQELARGLDGLAANASTAFEKPLEPLIASPSAPVPGQMNASASPTASASPSPGIQILVTTLPQEAGNQKIIALVSVVAIVAAILFLILVIRAKRPTRATQPAKLSPQQAAERLDALLLEGKISEKTYNELKARYSPGAGKAAARAQKTVGKRKKHSR
ncbi:MAG: hypothetical protein NTY90_00465, partial [Candidatus Micrarchaeota archaeon]|nr:hypothetical protein [Candidatus Micrarchaeota archaeon]